MAAFDLSTHPIHLGLGALAAKEPAFEGTASWYAEYAARHASDGHEGRLVSMHDFEASWTAWERHPLGHEIVVVTAGALVLIQEVDGAEQRVELAAGQAAINEPGVWHTIDVLSPGTAMFITAGAGTEHRPR